MGLKAYYIRKNIKEKNHLQNEANNKATLKSHELIKIYSKRTVVNHVSVKVKQGEIVGLLGPNGAGKTTTFYMITGMVRPNEGKILIEDKDITRLPMYRRAKKGVAYLPQEASIFRKLTVEENLLAIMQMIGIPRKAQKEKCAGQPKFYHAEAPTTNCRNFLCPQRLKRQYTPRLQGSKLGEHK